MAVAIAEGAKLSATAVEIWPSVDLWWKRVLLSNLEYFSPYVEEGPAILSPKSFFSADVEEVAAVQF